MESLLGAMSGVVILFGMGYLLLSIFIIVYFFRMGNDIRASKEILDDIKWILKKQENTEVQLNENSNSMNAKVSNNIKEIDKNLLLDLRQFILQESKRSPVLKSTSDVNILDILESVCTSNETCLKLIDAYFLEYRLDLIDDLIGLSKSYDKIKEFLSVFIRFKVVEEDYPHKKIN